MAGFLGKITSFGRSSPPPGRKDSDGSDTSIGTPLASGSPSSQYMGLAALLVKNSKLGKIFPNFQSKLEQLTADQLVEAKKRPDAHVDSDLIQVAKHTCTIDWVQKALATLDDEIEKRKLKGYSDMDLEPYIDGVLGGVALVLAQGFDRVEGAKLIRDASGKVVGITDPRQAQCDKALKSGEVLTGGKRKKRHTKKKSIKKRKTLRRVRH